MVRFKDFLFSSRIQSQEVGVFVGRVFRQLPVRLIGGASVPGRPRVRRWPRVPGQPPQQRRREGGRQEDDAQDVQVPRGERVLRHPDLLEADLGLQGRGRVPEEGLQESPQGGLRQRTTPRPRTGRQRQQHREKEWKDTGWFRKWEKIFIKVNTKFANKLEKNRNILTSWHWRKIMPFCTLSKDRKLDIRPNKTMVFKPGY